MKASRILIFIAAAIALLALVCVFFPPQGIKVGSVQLRFPDLHEILTPREQLDVEAYLAEQQAAEDSIMQLHLDSIASFEQMMERSDTRFWLPGDDYTFFDTLFAQLEQTSATGRTIRIVHYGDSQIEMDRISNRLRSHMQALFGGGGPGLVPVATLIPSLSVSTHGNGSLVRQSPFGDTLVVRANGNYGPMVQNFNLAGSSTTTITAATHHSCDDRLRQFSQFGLLFCNRPGPLTASFSANGIDTTVRFECRDEGVHLFRFKADSAVSSVRLSTQGYADLYGVMVDDGPGVAVDNIPMRGCSGHQFTQINASQLTEAYRLMDVGLIILQFGGNSVPYLKSEKSISRYCDELGKQIDRLHQCSPQSLILFIGPSDMSTRADSLSSLHTYTWLPAIVDSLQHMANEHNAAYWSIYHAMGGLNSMPSWVQSGLGGPDYIHFSQKGADIMGDRLAKAFENMYQLYLMRKRSRP